MNAIDLLRSHNADLAAVALGERRATDRQIMRACDWAFGHLAADEATRIEARLCAGMAATSADVLRMADLARHWRNLAASV